MCSSLSGRVWQSNSDHGNSTACEGSRTGLSLCPVQDTWHRSRPTQESLCLRCNGQDIQGLGYMICSTARTLRTLPRRRHDVYIIKFLGHPRRQFQRQLAWTTCASVPYLCKVVAFPKPPLRIEVVRYSGDRWTNRVSNSLARHRASVKAREHFEVFDARSELRLDRCLGSIV